MCYEHVVIYGFACLVAIQVWEGEGEGEGEGEFFLGSNNIQYFLKCYTMISKNFCFLLVKYHQSPKPCIRFTESSLQPSVLLGLHV